MDKFKSVFAIGLLILMIMPPSAALSKGYGNKGGGGWTDQTGTGTPYGTVYYNFPDETEVADLVFIQIFKRHWEIPTTKTSERCIKIL